MEHDRVNLHDLVVSDNAHQIVAGTTDDPLTANHIHAKLAAEQIVGRYDDDTLLEMLEESLRDSNTNNLNGDPDLLVCEEHVAGQQIIVFEPEARTTNETTVVRESRRLEFTNVSVAKCSIQVVATTTQIPITADGVHCGENAGQIAGRFSNKTVLEMWRAMHTATRQKRADTKAGSPRSFEHEPNSQK